MLSTPNLTRNALKTRWAADGVINFYTERNLKVINATEEQLIYYFQSFFLKIYYAKLKTILMFKPNIRNKKTLNS